MDLAIIIAVVVVALVFDYTNGFHDAANAIATSVSTRALTPRIALAMAAVMNFIGAFLGQEVANTVGGVITPSQTTSGMVVVMAGLFGAIAWNLLTWYFGLPSSSSHALIGGLVGAAIASGSGVKWDVIREKILIPMVASPLFGFAAAAVVMFAIMWIFRRANPNKAQRGFRAAQTLSAAAMALGHGLQDAQKTMGVIFLALVTGGFASADDDLPFWVILAAARRDLRRHLRRWLAHHAHARPAHHRPRPGARLRRRVGRGRACSTRPPSPSRRPISTTHTITSAVMGVGATKRLSAVRWGVARSIVAAWVLTFPMAGLMAALTYEILHNVFQLP